MITTVVIKPYSFSGSFSSNSHIVSLFSSIAINKFKTLLNIISYNYIFLILISI